MKNESYERLFKYAMQLHGKSKPIPIINLLIKRFIQTVKDEKVKMFDDIYKNQCNKNMNEMVEFVFNARDQFEIVEVHDQFVNDFFIWCGINNPEVVN